ncbi:MAG: xanthine dehydrogenase family protein molybdopterin-binding subunit [Pseudomonadota bacterium]|nr:xanthine dehydrogenase family protein molybdopterin-binding subunit [Pseudomonadota bacterium]
MTVYQNPVGQDLPRLEAREKITGRAEYTDDLSRPGMLHAAVQQSPYAHARIVSCDVSAALEVPGVVASFTGDDIGYNYIGPFVHDETAIAKGKVRYIGEPVAAVAAVDQLTARRAVALIEIEYEELPAVLSIDQAMAEDAPMVHDNFEELLKTYESEHAPNVMSIMEVEEGDAENAWAQCDVIVEGEYETQAQCHTYMEPCSALADIDANGKVTVWSGNQSVFHLQANIAQSLDMPMSKVRCVTPRVGGAFGGKMEQTIQPIVVGLTIKANRPVKLTLSREQDFEMIRSRHPSRVWMKTGATKDGTLVARKVDIRLDAGAYGDDSPGVAGICALFCRGPYHIQNVSVESRAVYTNKLRAGAFRGFGGPQVAIAGETQIDEIADKIGMDPIDLRLKNAARPNEEWLGGLAASNDAMSECLTQVRDSSDWQNRRAAALGPPVDGKRRSIGIACMPHISGLLTSGAIIRILEDGTAVLNTGAVDNGQGSDTVLVQMCAGALGIDVDKISLATPDTDSSPYNWGTTASRVTYMTGRAVVAAADSVIEQLKQRAASMMECAPEDLEMRPGGIIGISGVPEAKVTFGEISGFAHWVEGGPVIGSNSLAFDGESFDPKRGFIKGFPFGKIGAWIFAAQAVEIELDEATGKITPLEVWSAHDIGKAINPSSVAGQVEGGVVQGIGYALYEEMVWDTGRLANPSLMDYKIPGTVESPPKINTILIEEPDETGPFGAKGIGEPPIVGIAPAIANALAHTSGIRLRRLPMSSENVLRALREKTDGG